MLARALLADHSLDPSPGPGPPMPWSAPPLASFLKQIFVILIMPRWAALSSALPLGTCRRPAVPSRLDHAPLYVRPQQLQQHWRTPRRFNIFFF